ncbi:sugar transporter [Anopheles darlingi]|uniref:Sugar transporter n=1 Tax=Anopheles darlingi TaxID=43151 RepID=W5JA77_ANODA|nr:sugar transporter [Anopheles darlingi]
MGLEANHTPQDDRRKCQQDRIVPSPPTIIEWHAELQRSQRLESRRPTAHAGHCCSAHRQQQGKKRRKAAKARKAKIVLKGEKFEDPDPYQSAVRKTNYGKQRKEKLKFVGEKFVDPDPQGLAIRKASCTSATSGTTSDREVFQQYRTQRAETHPATVYLGYTKEASYITEMPETECMELDQEYTKNELAERWPSRAFTNLGSWSEECTASWLINIPIFIAWMLFHFASDVSFLYCGLALAGISGGLGEAPVLTYVAEITQPRYRGILAATGSTCVILGVLLEFLMGSFMKWRTVAFVSSVVPILAAILLFFIPESPAWLASKGRLEESQSALAWLRGWTTPEQVHDEFKELEQQMAKDAELQKDFTLVDKARLYTRRAFLQPFGIILLCFFIGHFSGMTTLQTYAVQIFHTLKAPINKYYATCLLGLTELIGTLFCVLLVHFTGKRPLVFISTIGCALCFFFAASYAYFLNDIPGSSVHNVVANVSSIKADITVIPLQSREVIAELTNSSVIPLLKATRMMKTQMNETVEKSHIGLSNASSIDGIVYSAQSFTNYYLNDSLNEPINLTITYGEYIKSAIPKEIFVPLPHVNQNKFAWVPLTLLLGSAFLTHIGIRLVPWILIGELFAPNVRSGGSGLAGGIAYIFGFIANKTFLTMLATFTLPGTFWIYSLITIVGAMILYKVLPETEGKSLQEIETYFLPSSKSMDTKTGALPLPGPKLSTSNGVQLQPAPPPIPPKPYPLKDDIDRARRVSLVPRQMSQTSRNTTVSDFSIASQNSQHSSSQHPSELSRSSSHNSYNLEDADDHFHAQVFRKISETNTIEPVATSINVMHSPEPIQRPASAHKTSSLDRSGKSGFPATPADSKPVFKHSIEQQLSHKTQQMTRPVRARAKRPPPSHAIDLHSWEGSKKFEEFLQRHQDVGVSEKPKKVRDPIRHVTSAHELKAFDGSKRKGSIPGGNMLQDRKMFNSSTKLTPTIVVNDVDDDRDTEGVTNAAFHLSSSDESTDM